ncbi:MAG: penicillin acylase family protein [Dehalococcoidia bacterium]
MPAAQSPDFAAAIPQMSGELTVQGLKGPVAIRRDAFGIAHVSATTEHDAWFGQAYASAQDRLWQMECDRRRATGRWAEAAGPDARFAGSGAVATDILGRRLRLEDAARADYAAMSTETRAMFDAYAEGVNAYLTSGQPLPVEFALCGVTPEPWQAWHSLALFKIRHVLMGSWQQKVTWGQVLARIGPDAYARLEAGSPPGSAVILPPGAKVESLLNEAADEIAAAAETLGYLAHGDGGSNSWAVHGSRTTTGKPVVCNDSHRGLDVPNAYWQIHVTCPEFNVIGATFAGLPGFPHFGYNGSVAWNITHTQADYQDLYVERFDADGRYATPAGPQPADRRDERIRVRGGDDVAIETWATAHGPVVHGDPRGGLAIAMRYTATDSACRQWEVLRPMLRATTVDGLFDTQGEWVDPVNNLVAADTSGNIGYLTRGRLPIRKTSAGRRMPVAGWTGEHEWHGDVPLERMPRLVNPDTGYIATSNQRVLDGDDPYISDLYAPAFRGDRLQELLGGNDQLTPERIASLQGDVFSVAARSWSRLLARTGPLAGTAEQARAMLSPWDGALLPDRGEGLLYAFFRRAITTAALAPIIGQETCRWLMDEMSPGAGRVLSHWLSNIVYRLESEFATNAPSGRPWSDVLPGALEQAWADAVAHSGSDPVRWRWDKNHGLASKHALSSAFPELDGALDPPRVPAGGDADTLQAAAYGWSGKSDFVMTTLPVYRQVVDFADPDHGSFVIPGGVSGLPGTAHYSDQLEHWRTHTRVPMRYRGDDVEANAAHTLTLRPA